MSIRGNVGFYGNTFAHDTLDRKSAVVDLRFQPFDHNSEKLWQGDFRGYLRRLQDKFSASKGAGSLDYLAEAGCENRIDIGIIRCPAGEMASC